MVETSKEKPAKATYGKGSAFVGKAGRSGPKPGNTNAQRHGMAGGKLPPGCVYIENRVNALRRQMEEAVLAAKGEIGVLDASAINSILKWERHGLLAAHWLRNEAEKLSAGDRLRFSEAIAKASDNRDRNIRALGLDAPPPSPWLAVEGSEEPGTSGKLPNGFKELPSSEHPQDAGHAAGGAGGTGDK